MHLYKVSGILLVVPIVNFAVAAPVLVQEKRQACADMADIPAYPITVLGKRGGINGIEEAGDTFIKNWFEVPKESSATHELSSSALSKPGHVEMMDMHAPPWSSSSAPSEPAHVEMSAVNSPAPNPGAPTEPAHLLTGMHAPLSSPVYPTYFHPDNELLRAHGSRPSTGPSSPSTEFDSDNRLVAEEPPSPTKGSFRWSRFEMVPLSPSSQVSSTDPSRQAKKSHRNSGAARDVWNAVQSELQSEWSEFA